MKLLKFTLIKITGCLIIGIILAHVFDLPFQLTLPFSIMVVAGLLITSLFERDQLEKSVLYGLFTMVAFIGIGMVTYQLHQPQQKRDHYLQNTRLKMDTNHMITFRIREVLKPSRFYDKYSIDLLGIDTHTVTGKMLLNVEKDTLLPLLNVDDILLSSAVFTEIKSPLNPHQFDYKNYLKKQYISHQIFTDDQHLVTLQSKPYTLLGYAAKLRGQINMKLRSYHIASDERALMNALLLGQRQDISSDIYDSYAKAGAVHILAVSGLHVGIILLLLNWLFKPLGYLKHGTLIKTLIIVLVLWSFAIIAGLSASVTRAVCMFSIVAVGMNLKRPANIFDTLAISMFFLLLFNPMFLFDVGFQMSYLAVIAIVSLQPSMVGLWRPKSWPVKKLWQIFTVTLAAQLGVVPISLYYFHQFPGLFFVSNLVILPVLGLILGLGILVILLALMNLLPYWLSDLYGAMISLMNSFVRWVGLQERFVLVDISFGWLQVLSAYILIVSFFLFMKRPNYKRLTWAAVGFLFFQGVLIFEKEKQHTSEFVIFHKNRHTLVGLKKHNVLRLAYPLDSPALATDPIVRNYNIGNSIQEIQLEPVQDLYLFNNKNILVVDSVGIYMIDGLYPEYVLLRHSPKINLKRLLDSLKPQLIIADGSNYKSDLLRWEQTCIKQKTPYHWTSNEGAFVLQSDLTPIP